jgi:hypothetical protein
MANHPTSDSLQILKNNSSDQSVTPAIPREGMMGKGADGAWYNLGVNIDGSIGQNASVELGYNAAGQLVRLRKVIGANTYTKLITGDEITDAVVATTKTFGVWT